jgi:hypothetical protein
MTARAVVIYESMFGNSRLVAETVALGVGITMPVSVIDAANASSALLPEIELLIVGAPTHAMGLPRGSTREDALRKFPEQAHTRTDGVREWLAGLECVRPVRTAVFDTRVHTPVYLGSAAKGIARRLHRLGFEVDAVTSFYVTGMTGPLEDGELIRAREWGTGLAEGVSRMHTVR